MILLLNDYNGDFNSICDYLLERIKKEQRAKTIQQCGYLLVKGLIKRKGAGNAMFDVLDDLFEIPKPKQKPQKTVDEFLDEFEVYVKGGAD